MENNILTVTFQRLRGRLGGMAGSILGNGGDAEDALHDAFCRLWTRYRDIDSESDARRLSYTAVYNASIDCLRRGRTRGAVSLDDVGEIADDEPSAAPEDAYAAVVKMAETVLNARQMEVFRLHDLENRGYDEVARQLGMTPENVRMTLSRARKSIREYYRRQQL